jgi:hypothetical protein
MSTATDNFCLLISRKQDSLRKRFGNALHWYNTLQDAMENHIDNILRHTRRIQFSLDDGLSHWSTSSTPRQETPRSDNESTPRPPSRAPAAVPSHDYRSSMTPSPSPSMSNAGLNSTARKRPLDDEDDTEDETVKRNPFQLPRPRVRPSDYLRRRCPLCFGGKFTPGEPSM